MKKARDNLQQKHKDKNKKEEWWWFWLKSESVLKTWIQRWRKGDSICQSLSIAEKAAAGQLDSWTTGHFKSYWVCERRHGPVLVLNKSITLVFFISLTPYRCKWWELRLEPRLTSKKLVLVLLQVNLPFYRYNSRFTNTSLLEINILFTTKILLQHFGYVLSLILYK